ncbi:MAG: diguanylate cyclase [Treponema sp.]|nr:diguanylate cyclase [Treponema sp.]
MAQKIRIHIPTVVAVIFTIAILFGSFFWFSHNTDEMIEGTTKFYLETNARSQAAAFNTKLENQVELLRTAARSWENVDMTSDEAVHKAILLGQTFGSFSRISVAGTNGRMFDTTGKDRGDVTQTLYFKRALRGSVTISDTIMSDSEIGDYLYIAVPILQNQKSYGVLYGQFPISVLSDLIEAVGFQEASTSILLSSDGMILARSATNELVTSRIKNFYDLGTKWGLRGNLSLTDIKVDIMSGKTFTVPYQSGTRDRLAILTPVGMNNWYYAIVISQDLIRNQSHALSINLLIVEFVLIFAFVLLFITILHLLRSMAVVEMANDRFQMVTSQTQAIVFDYDFVKQHLELNGNLKFINKNAKDSYSTEEIFNELGKLLHENDKSILDEIIDLRNNDKASVLSEMRIQCADGNYYWHRLTGTVVRDDDGQPRRLVGNFVNVEDEINKQKLLKQKAEIDPLSGLLNKGAFTSYVSDLLAESNEENLYAFYIIDLDNFKKVNDTLGHIVGDHVISDVAQKLCTVFSENDYVGRIGGDEFAAFLKLSGTGIKLGRKIIEAKAKAACSIIDEIYSDDKNEVNITSSIGVSIYPKNGKKFEDLYKNADSVLYKSKNGGKNQYNICE